MTNHTKTHSFELSDLELAELVAGLDSLQRAGLHGDEICFPLRSRLRAALFPVVEAVVEAVEPIEAPSDPVDSSADVEPVN